jgi:putative PIN family toxin of toxin-antitoxin system
MKVVIDTNVLINCVSSRTKYHVIWQAFLSGEITLFASADILLEYEELVQQKYPAKIASDILDILFDPDYVKQQDIYYYWNVITIDKDDNKFFDTAVACNADCLVTNDNHFKSAKKIAFPKVNILSADEFLKVLGFFTGH